MMLQILKMTSVIASCANAWTLEFLMRRHQSQQRALIRTVLAIMIIAEYPSSIMVGSPDVKRLTHWRATWKNEVTIIIEKTNTPIGSSLRRPTGYIYESCRAIKRVVVQTIAVLRKSKAESTKLA